MMKTYFTGIVTLLFVALVSADTIRLSEPVEVTETSETFGQPINNELPKVDLSMLTDSPEKYLNQPFLLTTRVAKVCQKKGCFFIAQKGPDILRVAFKDYGFFIPTDSKHKAVTLNGTLTKKMLTKEQAAHFNQDLKATSEGDINSGVVYEIVASAVRLPKS